MVNLSFTQFLTDSNSPVTDIDLGTVGTFACIEHLICAINCILLDYYIFLVDLDSYTGMAGMRSCVTTASDHVPIGALANLSQSIHHSFD